jgi:hypothetical protein
MCAREAETEVTPEMIEAGHRAFLDHGEAFYDWPEIFEAVYRAMAGAKKQAKVVASSDPSDCSPHLRV